MTASSRRTPPAAAQAVVALHLVPWRGSGEPIHDALKPERVLRDYLDLSACERAGATPSPHMPALRSVVEGLLARVLDGDAARNALQVAETDFEAKQLRGQVAALSPRAMFNFDRKKMGTPVDDRRTAAMCLEFLRLHLEHPELDEPAIRVLIATAFEVEPRTVERACTDWAPILKPRAVAEYIAKVRAEGLDN